MLYIKDAVFDFNFNDIKFLKNFYNRIKNSVNNVFKQNNFK